MSTATDTTESLAVDASEGARLIGCGKTLFKQMDSDGRLGPMAIKFGRLKRWDRAELKAWFAAGRPRREVWASEARAVERSHH